MGCFLDLQEATRCSSDFSHYVTTLCVCGISSGGCKGTSSPPGGASTTAAVEVAAELREVNCGCSGCGTVEAEVSGCCRFPGLLHAGERGIDLLLLSERRGGRGGGHLRSGGRGEGGK